MSIQASQPTTAIIEPTLRPFSEKNFELMQDPTFWNSDSHPFILKIKTEVASRKNRLVTEFFTTKNPLLS